MNKQPNYKHTYTENKEAIEQPQAIGSAYLACLYNMLGYRRYKNPGCTAQLAGATTPFPFVYTIRMNVHQTITWKSQRFRHTIAFTKYTCLSYRWSRWNWKIGILFRVHLMDLIRLLFKLLMSFFIIKQPL